MKAANLALNHVRNDPAFHQTINMLVQFAVAAKKADPQAHLASVGINLPINASLPDLLVSLTHALRAPIDKTPNRPDLADIAQRALVGAFTNHICSQMPLFSPGTSEVASSLSTLGRKDEFGKLARGFFSELTRGTLDYFLSKTLNTHLGEGKTFPTVNQKIAFDNALSTHCVEASEIVERFCGDWFSKHHFEGKGDIGWTVAKNFGWGAVEKIKSELSRRAEP